DYASSERACETAQRLLEHPDYSTRRREYAFSLALGRGLAIQNQHGRVREALPHLTQALSLATLSKNADDIALTLVNLGWAHYQAGDAPAAKPLLERVLRETPTSMYVLPATLSLGDIACGEGAYDEARRRFETGRALAAKLTGEGSPRQRHFDDRLAMLEKTDGERCSRP
ncbi:MAG TPA: tetratricopeptide repeat protein, partial [Tahibacter sp.]|nr:tetratricopeptide repeat protein [Tahibacter sp.]